MPPLSPPPRRLRPLAAIALMALLAVPAQAIGVIKGQASVIDGDTIDIGGTRIRLHGVDAPESRQTCTRDGKPYLCGQVAANALADLIGRRHVTCSPEVIDKYGRTVARCEVNGQDLGAWLVRNGHAMAYRKYGGSMYDAEEYAARSARVGIWAGTFQKPEEWRHAH